MANEMEPMTKAAAIAAGWSIPVVPTPPTQGNIVTNPKITNIPSSFTGTRTTTPLEQEASLPNPNIQPRPASTQDASTPSIAGSGVPEPSLPTIPIERFATPSPRVAKTKEELQKIKTDIKELEVKTRLNRLPYLFGGELARIKNQFSDLNINKYYLLLLLLVGGFDNNILVASIGENHADRVIDDNFIKDFQRMINDPRFSDMLKKTPAFAKGCFKDIGQLGNVAANGDRMEQNPLTGPKRYGPSLVTNMLRKIHPDSVENIENFCNVIRSRAYLSMPKGAFGSLRKVVAILNGAISAFNRKLRQFYKGLNKLIKEVYALINGIIAEINKLLISIIEEIIPLDFLCLLLDTAQVLLDDIGFFVGLFNMSGPFLNYLNIAQTAINTASGFLSNPFGTIVNNLPSEVQDVVRTIESIGEDPESFISDTLSNYGLSYIATALQGDIVGAMIQKFGKNYYYNSGPLADVMSKAKAIWDRYSADGSTLPELSDLTDPNYYAGGVEDIYGNTVDEEEFDRNEAKDLKAIQKDPSKFASTFSNTAGSLFGDFLNKNNQGLDELNNLPSAVNNVFGDIKNTLFKSNKDLPDNPEVSQ
jgi:hypothetical protein